jgi:hypothetical protein
MNGKKIAAALLFLAGAVIGTSDRTTKFWDGYPFWLWLIAFVVGLAICGVAVDMWRSAGKSVKSQ